MNEGRNNTSVRDNNVDAILSASSSENIWIEDCETRITTGKEKMEEDRKQGKEQEDERSAGSVAKIDAATSEDDHADLEALKRKWHNRKSVLEMEAATLRQRIDKKNEKLRKRIIILMVFLLIAGGAVGLIVGLG